MELESIIYYLFIKNLNAGGSGTRMHRILDVEKWNNKTLLSLKKLITIHKHLFFEIQL